MLYCPMHSDYYVYCLFRRDGQPYYVGKGRAGRWTRHSKRAGCEIPTVKVRQGLTNGEALTLEKTLIRVLGRRPVGPLVNKNPGGTGPATASAATRQRLREFHKGKQWALGHRHTPETIEVIRATSTGRRYPSRKAKPKPPPKPRDYAAIGAKVSAALKGRSQSPEHRAKTIANLVRGESMWITDGLHARRVQPSTPIPNGWQRGRPEAVGAKISANSGVGRGWVTRRARQFVTEN